MPKIHIFISISYSITVVSGVSWVFGQNQKVGVLGQNYIYASREGERDRASHQPNATQCRIDDNL